MAKHWARIVMGLIFVFVTISSPLHAQAMPAMSHDVPAAAPSMALMHMDGMSDACAKAMMAQANAVKSNKPVKTDHSGGCCSNGCNCPLSHCPATPPALAVASLAMPRIEPAMAISVETQTLRSYLVETLKRPPRA